MLLSPTSSDDFIWRRACIFQPNSPGMAEAKDRSRSNKTSYDLDQFFCRRSSAAVSIYMKFKKECSTIALKSLKSKSKRVESVALSGGLLCCHHPWYNTSAAATIPSVNQRFYSSSRASGEKFVCSQSAPFASLRQLWAAILVGGISFSTASYKNNDYFFPGNRQPAGCLQWFGRTKQSPTEENGREKTAVDRTLQSTNEEAGKIQANADGRVKVSSTSGDAAEHVRSKSPQLMRESLPQNDSDVTLLDINPLWRSKQSKPFEKKFAETVRKKD